MLSNTLRGQRQIQDCLNICISQTAWLPMSSTLLSTLTTRQIQNSIASVATPTPQWDML